MDTISVYIIIVPVTGREMEDGRDVTGCTKKGYNDMKSKYVAVMLGLIMAVSPASVYATETDTELEVVEVDDEDLDDEDSEILYEYEDDEYEMEDDVEIGQVTEVSADSITIASGILVENDADGEEAEGEETSGTEKIPVTLELDAIEYTYFLSDDVVVLRETEPMLAITVKEAEYDEEESYEEAEDLELEELTEEEIELLDADTEEEEEEIPTEEISIDDIQVGDIVMIVMDADYNITITVIQQNEADADEAADVEETADEA
jgi:hypothetical protein